MQRNFMSITHILFYFLLTSCSKGKVVNEPVKVDPVKIAINMNSTAQTIRNFAASDAWAVQFVGNWPDAKRNQMADWLFSMETTAEGNPKGIGLTMWRTNIGAGSAQLGEASGIKDEWRRAASPLLNDNSELVKAQNWFLAAAKQRGVNQFLAFYNSPPVNLTLNQKAFANNGVCNISEANMGEFAKSAVSSLKAIEAGAGIKFDYLSPVNEPQWDWSDGGQEGNPYTNAEVSKIVKSFHQEFVANNINTKLLIPESGHIRYLFPNSDKANKDDQVKSFFDPSSNEYVGNLSTVFKGVAAHSYFSTSPSEQSINDRKKIREVIAAKDGLEYWQSEYCILGDNGGEINGSRKDLGMTPALYIARVIQQDLVYANATAWQWWISISPYDYKDGLIYIDKNKTDGNISDSKMLWALGNYSRFIRPGMVRVEAASNNNDLHVSAFKDAGGKLVLVVVNPSAIDKPLELTGLNKTEAITYTTSAMESLAKKTVQLKDLVVKKSSVMTVVVE